MLSNILSGKLPASEFSQCPFWFWNDSLEEKEILRQIADFQNHGVDAFLIHPRIGLPHSIRWSSPELFYYMKVAVAEAKRRNMWVMLYDEGMYPSGSASGQVVERNPAFQARGLSCSDHELCGSDLRAKDKHLLAKVKRANGRELWIYDQKIDAVIRGLHYLGDETAPDPPEEEPAAADLLNPEAVQCFIELVYDRFYTELGSSFGSTIKAIFTDEPHPMSRCRESGIAPGTSDILARVNSCLGYDFTPHLPALWFDDEPGAGRCRRDYAAAISSRMDETFYRPVSRWCEEHGIALAGHPAEPADIGHLKHFHIPGQDIVWRQIEPFQASALEGPPSTMAKAAASTAFHLGRPRNLNEFAGAYGHSLTFFELQWLASWLLVRGCNLLIPHAFYYSVRGLRKDERPPDVGPHSPWWQDYRAWADFTRRLCWLNATFHPVCEVAILGRRTELPWQAAKSLFEHQVDFHYVDPDDLAGATLEDGIICVGQGRYSTLVVEEGFEHQAAAFAPVVRWSEAGWNEIQKRVHPVVALDHPAPGLRARHLRSGNCDVVLLFNEGEETLERRVIFPARGNIQLMDLATGQLGISDPSAPLLLAAGAWAAMVIRGE